MSRCEKHGLYSVLCRACDLDLLAEEERRKNQMTTEPKLPKFGFDDVSQRLSYEPETGVLTWVKHKPMDARWNRRGGKGAGWLNTEGYILIGILRHQIRAHWLAWLLYYKRWPSMHLDHINGERTDNRIANLREASIADNNRNMRCHREGRIAGVSFGGNKWRARIGHKGTNIHLGVFETMEEAMAARKDAEHVYK